MVQWQIQNPYRKLSNTDRSKKVHTRFVMFLKFAISISRKFFCKVTHVFLQIDLLLFGFSMWKSCPPIPTHKFFISLFIILSLDKFTNNFAQVFFVCFGRPVSTIKEIYEIKSKKIKDSMEGNQIRKMKFN